MTVGDGLILTVVILGLLPVTVLVIESVAALLPLPTRQKLPDAPRLRTAVLIPAHNEELGIQATLSSLIPQLHPDDRILVVADNCTDQTAQIARETGVIVLERNDEHNRGKGYALDFGLRHLQADPPDVVVIVDADSHPSLNALDQLVRSSTANHCPVQAVYVDRPTNPGVRESWSAFALLFKNHVRPLGLHRLGLPCLLTGSGMAFPWDVLQRVSLASGNIVEDMKLGIDLAIAGHAPRFCPGALIESEDAPNRQAAVTRRTRWEHGHVHTLVSQSPRLLLAGLKKRSPGLLGLTAELSVPPLSLLLLLCVGLILVSSIWGGAEGSWLPLTILLAGMSIWVLTIFLVWVKFGIRVLSPKFLVLLPVYVLWKLPIYLKMMINPEKSWVRTERKKPRL